MTDPKVLDQANVQCEELPGGDFIKAIHKMDVVSTAPKEERMTIQDATRLLGYTPDINFVD